MSKTETPEEKIARLETENTALLGEKNTAVAALETAKTDRDELQKAHDALLTESTSEIERLSLELDSAKSDVAKSIVTISVSGTKYRVIGKQFNIPGKGELTVDQIIKDKELLKDLVKKEVGFLVPVE